MIKKLTKLLAVLMIVISATLPLVLANPVLATAAPDSTPTLTNTHGFINLIESGDVLIIGNYNIPYAVIPDEPVTLTYMIILQDSTGNQTGFCSPYAYFDYGYNLGCWAMYFPASANFTDGVSYNIIIKQSPAYFSDPQSYSYTMETSAWFTGTTQDENQNQLYLEVINMADQMEATYTTYTLTEPGLTNTVLYSPTGENYFRNVINGLQIMAPDLFLYQLIPYETSTVAYTTNMSDNYTSRYTGTWVGDSTNATGAQFGMSGGAIMAMGFAAPICLAMVIVSAKKFHTVTPGFMAVAMVVMVTFMMGWMPAALFATLYQICGIYIAYVVFYARG